MSQENVEVVRASYEAWNAGDMDAVRALTDPDVLLRHPDGWPEPGPRLEISALTVQTRAPHSVSWAAGWRIGCP